MTKDATTVILFTAPLTIHFLFLKKCAISAALSAIKKNL